MAIESGEGKRRPAFAANAAAAALRDGRIAIARSFRFHRARGAFCHAGWCQQCRVSTPEGPRLACRLAVDENHSRLELDPLRIAGMLAELLPPWFHEFRLPPPLRQAFLLRLRKLSAAPAPPIIFSGSQSHATAPLPDICHTLVAGGGMAGLAAARLLAQKGADVLLVEAETLGGRARFGPETYEDIASAAAAARAAGAQLVEWSLVAGIYEKPRRALVRRAGGVVIVLFERLVVATGAYDRLPAFLGNDLPGIIGGSAFARLMMINAIPAGLTVVFCGPTRETEPLARMALSRGLKIAHISQSVPVRARGSGSLQYVQFRDNGNLAADLLVTCWRQAACELALQAGCTITLSGAPPVLMPSGQAHLPLLLTGSASGQTQGSPSAEPTLIAPEFIIADDKAPLPTPHPGSMVCHCEDVRACDIDRAIADGYDEIETLKRRTGAGTGPCQGKLCHAEIASCLARRGHVPAIPTQRPFVRPVMLSDLAGART